MITQYLNNIELLRLCQACAKLPLMKQPLHPTMNDVSLETLCYALGDATRLQIIANLHKGGKRALICAEATAGIAQLSSSTSSYHFRMLREGGIVHSVRKGKECYNTLRLDELEKKFPGVMKAVLKSLA